MLGWHQPFQGMAFCLRASLPAPTSLRISASVPSSGGPYVIVGGEGGPSLIFGAVRIARARDVSRIRQLVLRTSANVRIPAGRGRSARDLADLLLFFLGGSPCEPKPRVFHGKNLRGSPGGDAVGCRPQHLRRPSAGTPRQVAPGRRLAASAALSLSVGWL